ncbi:MAG: DUF4114 domain-containing protein [Planctomycetes bacterium]|nr:DUF4114 domain-containing protein [Planctomycetota bacterium]
MQTQNKVAWRALTVLCTVSLYSQAALADFTPVKAAPSNEWSHARILEALYSPGYTWATFGGRVDTAGNPVDYSNGEFSALRVDDFGLGGPLDVVNGNTGSADDQLWTGGSVSGTAVARFASYKQEFGYLVANDRGKSSYVKLFEVSGSGMAVSGSASAEFSPSDEWAWARGGSGKTWYSQDALNHDGENHLVTYRIDGLNDGVSRWILFWEDLNNLGDADYNDLVVEVTAVPEPGAFVLAALGLAWIVSARRRG